MSFKIFHGGRRFWRAEFLSPKDLLFRAVTISVLFLIAHIAGLRDYTSFLSGTLPSPETSWKQASFFGLVYLLLYFAVVLFSPILLLAAGMLKGWELLKRARTRKEPSWTGTSDKTSVNASAKSGDDQPSSSDDIPAAADR